MSIYIITSPSERAAGRRKVGSTTSSAHKLIQRYRTPFTNPEILLFVPGTREEELAFHAFAAEYREPVEDTDSLSEWYLAEAEELRVVLTTFLDAWRAKERMAVRRTAQLAERKASELVVFVEDPHVSDEEVSNEVIKAEPEIEVPEVKPKPKKKPAAPRIKKPAAPRIKKPAAPKLKAKSRAKPKPRARNPAPVADSDDDENPLAAYTRQLESALAGLAISGPLSSIQNPKSRSRRV